MGTYTNLLCEQDDGITLVIVNRPEKLNALNAATISALEQFFKDAAGDQSIRAVILTGAGHKSFVAGADIEEISGLTPLEGRDWGLKGQVMLHCIERLEKPVMAAVNGYALGGGLELAMACHMRIAASHAKLGQPEMKLGIVPGFGGTQRLPRIVGKGRALEMLLTGDPIDADEAFRMGLVNRVVLGDQLLQEARSLMQRILKNGPVSVALTLQAVNRGCEMPLAEALEWEVSQYALSCSTEDMREGTQAFLEKRKPVFKGR